MTGEKKLDPKYLEDLSEYLVEVSSKKPYFYKNMQSAVLQCKDRFLDGDVLAVHDALTLCERGMLPLPPWLSQAVRSCVIDSLTGGMSGKKGRSNSPLGSAKKILRQQAHYRLVKKCQRIAGQLKAESMVAGILTGGRLEFMGDLRHVFPPVFWEKIGDPKSNLNVSDFGNTLESNYLAASKILTGTFAQAEPRTIRKSFKTIESLMANGHSYSSHVDWFAVAEPETLEALGLQLDMSEAEMLAWEMGQEFVEPDADRSQVDHLFFVDVDQLEGMAEKP